MEQSSSPVAGAPCEGIAPRARGQQLPFDNFPNSPPLYSFQTRVSAVGHPKVHAQGHRMRRLEPIVEGVNEC
jgi:hypothetical protein